ncbi:succinate dehydrogenase iron-sulfur subunit [Candidatus Haliotispira prima]|uniref:Fumarate reductase iron-sulfur subunit n=1 Tax=Candidatus Haliotispira prima TaxID=3034016 RepID=A0ABY8MEB2_9SPIO|nr:succinate dehydrogenase iron-sulfur subunit [Candidatus Haliotispira prima]
MKTRIKIKRFNPKAGTYYSEFEVEVDESTRVIDALEDIAKTQDTTLTFRRSCLHGVCGSDAMRINGKERLACKTLFQDVSTGENQHTVEIEALRHLEVKTDLVVEQKTLLEKYESVKPYFMPKDKLPDAGEFVQTPREHKLLDEASACIGCASCYSACPVLDKNPDFIGPMALVQAARFLDDSRDQGIPARLEALDSPNGLWACENLFECTKVCPRGIKITKLINHTKRKVKKYREEQSETTSAKVSGIHTN